MKQSCLETSQCPTLGQDRNEDGSGTLCCSCAARTTPRSSGTLHLGKAVKVGELSPAEWRQFEQQNKEAEEKIIIMETRV